MLYWPFLAHVGIHAVQRLVSARGRGIYAVIITQPSTRLQCGLSRTLKPSQHRVKMLVGKKARPVALDKRFAHHGCFGRLHVDDIQKAAVCTGRCLLHDASRLFGASEICSKIPRASPSTSSTILRTFSSCQQPLSRHGILLACLSCSSTEAPCLFSASLALFLLLLLLYCRHPAVLACSLTGSKVQIVQQ